jgi:hypothetical protein
MSEGKNEKLGNISNNSETDDLEDTVSKEEEEEEYQGRNWNQLVIAIVFVLAVVILWYVLTR